MAAAIHPTTPRHRRICAGCRVENPQRGFPRGGINRISKPGRPANRVDGCGHPPYDAAPSADLRRTSVENPQRGFPRGGINWISKPDRPPNRVDGRPSLRCRAIGGFAPDVAWKTRNAVFHAGHQPDIEARPTTEPRGWLRPCTLRHRAIGGFAPDVGWKTRKAVFHAGASTGYRSPADHRTAWMAAAILPTRGSFSSRRCGRTPRAGRPKRPLPRG